jgi:hypothetical protein
MTALRNVEDTIGGFVERIFGRLFRGHVEPVELARKLAREMEDHKTVSVSRVYVPNEYVIYLSPADRNRFASFESSLTTELGVYVSERARHEGFTLLSEPKVTLEADTDLRVGEYGIACRVVDPPVEAPAEVDAATPELPDPPPLPLPVAPAPAAAIADDAPSANADVADEPDPFLEAAAGEPPEGVLVDELPAVGVLPLDPGGEDDAPVVEDEPDDLAQQEPEPVIDQAQAADLPRPIAPEQTEAVDAEPEPEPPIVAPEPEPEPAPVARVEPAPEPPPVPEIPVPAPAVAMPLPPPGGYEPLAGVSGTQILSAADARAEGLVQEEMAVLVEGRRVSISKRATTIGRSRECDIVVQDSNASRLHAEIRHIGLDYFIVDSNSTNGTIVNGQHIRRHALANGDRILIGTTELIVEHS